MSGTLYLVATPIGNLEDITLRALRILSEVPLIAAEDTRAAERLLRGHGLLPRADGRPAPRLLSCFEGNEARRAEELMELLLGGADVALISEAGMPGISDPGQRIVRAAVERGIAVVVVPGPSAPLCALLGSGLPAERFLFVGFLPREEGRRQELLGSLRAEPGTLIMLESPERLGRTLAELCLSLGGERQACLARELTKVHEELVRAPLSELSRRYEDRAPRGEITLVVEGARAPEARPEGDIEDEIGRRLAAGQGAREIAAALALRTGRPRRQIYQLAIALSGVRR